MRMLNEYQLLPTEDKERALLLNQLAAAKGDPVMRPHHGSPGGFPNHPRGPDGHPIHPQAASSLDSGHVTNPNILLEFERANAMQQLLHDARRLQMEQMMMAMGNDSTASLTRKRPEPDYRPAIYRKRSKVTSTPAMLMDVNRLAAPPANSVPCRCRGMPDDHNPKTAYIVIPKDVMHGQALQCSHPICRHRGVRFRYCSACQRPVAKRNFSSRHNHPKEDFERVEKEKAEQPKPQCEEVPDSSTAKPAAEDTVDNEEGSKGGDEETKKRSGAM